MMRGMSLPSDATMKMGCLSKELELSKGGEYKIVGPCFSLLKLKTSWTHEKKHILTVTLPLLLSTWVIA